MQRDTGRKLHIILNKLVKLSTDEYDADGTAEMVISCLLETLGVSRSKLALMLVHFVYDGVYASKDERVNGGGCLDLKNKVASKLGLEPGSITGDWDSAHNMKLVWADILKQRKWILNVTDTYFKVMQSKNTGKAATHFEERAEELGHIVLTNKTYQTTRFVRALLRGLTAAIRNLPTLVNILAEDFNEAALQFNNRESQKVRKDPEGVTKW